MADPKDLARPQPQAGQPRDWSGALGSVTDAAPASPAPAATVEDAGFMGSALYEKGKTVHNKRIDGPFRRFTGGAMEMAPRAKVDDGELDVIRIGTMPRLRFFSSFPSIFRGTHTTRPEVEATRARRVEFEIEGDVDCMIDGEIVRLRPRSVEVVPHAMRVIA